MAARTLGRRLPPPARTASLMQSCCRLPSVTTRIVSAKRVRRSSPTAWESCECVRLQKITCRGAMACRRGARRLLQIKIEAI